MTEQIRCTESEMCLLHGMSRMSAIWDWKHSVCYLGLAPELYGVATGTLNQAVQRNIERFPADFMFCLTVDEVSGLRCQTGTSNADPNALKSQIVIAKNAESSKRGGRRTLPYAFTEQGVAMLSSVLRSTRAVEVNIASCAPSCSSGG